MKWFFWTWGSAVAVLFLGFIAWIATRTMHADAANYYVGRVIVYDLYALAVIMCYVAFVGGWHIWERLTGRMELDVEDRRDKARARRADNEAKAADAERPLREGDA
jgi:type VI protein secretion system component VasK